MEAVAEDHDLGLNPRYDSIRRDLLKRLYERWDPAYVLQESDRLARDRHVLESWGRAVQLLHKDCVPVPEVEEVVLV